MLFISNSLTFGILLLTAIISFGLGLLYKSAVVAKQRKRILTLEDEMLSNHANILALEKKIIEIQKEKVAVQHDLNSRKSERELKAS
jgi:Tfp pilus assembly protein PilN